MLLGLRTVVYHVEDLQKAKEWYKRAFGIEPYFDEPYYVGFNVGGYELGLDPDVAGAKRGNTPVAYWGVTDIATAYEDLVAAGAKPVEHIKDVGEHIQVATLLDPFGNTIGIIENPHFRLAE